MAAVIDTIIIPVVNRYDLLNRCVASIPRAHRLIIIDNGAGIRSDQGIDALAEHDGIEHAHILSMPTPLSVAASWNLGIKTSPDAEDGWLLLNSDAWFDPGAFDAYAADTSRDAITLGGAPGWCCAFIGVDVVRRIGLFCERFHPAYMEDVDYERRARMVGIPIRYSDALIGHDNSSTIRANPEWSAKNTQTHAANHAFYEWRWANARDGLPDVHEWHLDTIRRQSW